MMADVCFQWNSVWIRRKFQLKITGGSLPYNSNSFTSNGGLFSKSHHRETSGFNLYRGKHESLKTNKISLTRARLISESRVSTVSFWGSLLFGNFFLNSTMYEKLINTTNIIHRVHNHVHMFH